MGKQNKNLNKIIFDKQNLKHAKQYNITPHLFNDLTREDLNNLYRSNPWITEIFRSSTTVNIARERLFQFLNRRERFLLLPECDLSPLEVDIALSCIRTLKNIISPLYEEISDFSALNVLYDIFDGKIDSNVKAGFIHEFIHLFKGISGKSGVYNTELNSKTNFDDMTPREVSLLRSKELDKFSETIKNYISIYKSGLEEELIKLRVKSKEKILKYFKATEEDWLDYRWHLKNVITKLDTLEDLIKLDSDERIAIKLANKYNIPFGITPYYLSLMDLNGRTEHDYSIRSQVIPTLGVVKRLSERWNERFSAFDFMKEAYTSPIDLITRRYPQIVILKPVSTCSQICTYCQRNWEINSVFDKNAIASKVKIREAICWIKENECIEEVLITGGDPFILSDNRLEELLSQLSKIDHIKRIRIGTRMIVTLPYRITDNLVRILDKYHIFGRREIAIVSHFEHVSEVTPDVVKAVKKIRKAGISIYNQEVFTFANSRRFESVALRKLLKICGIDPYYIFNTKGKEETKDYMVPIARLLQERKEEARLVPGLDRTDEPVFNVPGLGKNYLKSFQDHKVVMILSDGSRVYEFHPWEKNIKNTDVYYYKDVPIFDYLMRLKHLRNEDIEAYKTIWYYY
ncbi:MAG: KamA family radical SAM protein [Candidatus Marinimicrobia bacterium]|nr:KamA family radical SAM protein [Candidatus Neomarinimicrobiota bacterium]